MWEKSRPPPLLKFLPPFLEAQTGTDLKLALLSPSGEIVFLLFFSDHLLVGGGTESVWGKILPGWEGKKRIWWIRFLSHFFSLGKRRYVIEIEFKEKRISSLNYGKSDMSGHTFFKIFSNVGLMSSFPSFFPSQAHSLSPYFHSDRISLFFSVWEAESVYLGSTKQEGKKGEKRGLTMNNCWGNGRACSRRKVC